MKKLTKISLTTSTLLATAIPALAATGTRSDDSMTLVYLFLGVCSLIIFLQLIPVFVLAFGFVKGIFSNKEEDAKPVTVRNR